MQMMYKMIYLFFLFFLLSAGLSAGINKPFSEYSEEIDVILIPLKGPLADRNSEISGMAWYKDHLILLPQYPNRFGAKGMGYLFALSKENILSYLNGVADAELNPIKIEFDSGRLEDQIVNFEGFESIIFNDGNVYLTVESSPDKMMGYLVSGNIQPDLSRITIDSTKMTKIKPQADIPNACEETMLIADNKIITIYEGNGGNVNPGPVAHVFNPDLSYSKTVPFPIVEYRITDATIVDTRNRFWVINYFWPGEKKAYKPNDDEIFAKSGKGESHSHNETVERLIELEVQEDRIVLTKSAPIQLRLLPGDSRNWEGIVRLDDLGFLLITDKFPQTILGFVKKP